MIKNAGIVVELGVRSVPSSLAFYCNSLGLSVVETASDESGESIWAELEWGESRLMLQRHDELIQELPALAGVPGTSSAVVVVRTDIEAARELHRLVPAASPLCETDYGTVEFHASDPDGYLVLVAGR